MRVQGYPDPGAGLRLHLNENTGGCSPRVLEAIQRLKTTDVSTYPSYPQLVRACARHFDVDPEWVLLTNGLDEGILMAALTAVDQDQRDDGVHVARGAGHRGFQQADPALLAAAESREVRNIRGGSDWTETR